MNDQLTDEQVHDLKVRLNLPTMAEERDLEDRNDRGTIFCEGGDDPELQIVLRDGTRFTLAVEFPVRDGKVAISLWDYTYGYLGGEQTGYHDNVQDAWQRMCEVISDALTAEFKEATS